MRLTSITTAKKFYDDDDDHDDGKKFIKFLIRKKCKCKQNFTVVVIVNRGGPKFNKIIFFKI